MTHDPMTEAIEAAARALGQFYMNPEWADAPLIGDIDNPEQFMATQAIAEEYADERHSQTEAMREALNAAIPILRAQFAEEVAGAIEATPVGPFTSASYDARDARADAANIARTFTTGAKS